jgi:hypothetical protein
MKAALFAEGGFAGGTGPALGATGGHRADGTGGRVTEGRVTDGRVTEGRVTDGRADAGGADPSDVDRQNSTR